MKSTSDYRNADDVRRFADLIADAATREWSLMEVCGGQTHSILRYGLDQLLPANVRLIHGPGCPVCVTPLERIDKAIELAGRDGVTLTSFGDMLRVPGSTSDLLRVKSAGGDVRPVYSPLDAVRLAAREPTRHVVFFAIGFETTAPANAMAVLHAQRLGLQNFSILASHVLVPPALEAILGSPHNLVQGILAAGHVCAVMGYAEYEGLAERRGVPIVVTGFEPVDLLAGVLETVRLLERGEAAVVNRYERAVARHGNPAAVAAIRQVFETTDQQWRGIGLIPKSGLKLRPELARFDAERRFDFRSRAVAEPPECHAGEVLQGHLRPDRCPAFGKTCTPDRPLGAPMVSSEGACAAYFNYRRSSLVAKETSHA